MSETQYRANNDKKLVEYSTNDPLLSLIFILVIFASIVIIGAIIKYTWNISIAQIFKVSEINLYQALGLFVLCNILFK